MSNAVMMPLTFARALHSRKDLDPIYDLAAQLPDMPGQPQTIFSGFERSKFVFAYLMFYDVAVALLLAASSNFQLDYEAIIRAKGGPRGSERRHFRGANAALALGNYSWWKTTLELLEADCLTRLTHPRFSDVYARMLTMPTAGKWLSFKATDMLERCGLLSQEGDDYINDSIDCCNLWYESPNLGWGVIQDIYGERLNGKFEFLVSVRASTGEPPGSDHRLEYNYQELETICCKYLSHSKKRYQPGDDVAHIMKQLDEERIVKKVLPFLGVNDDLRLDQIESVRKWAKDFYGV